jgi:predicted DCC family thiol-disulfide oxidoreductase YuxK
MQFIIFFDGDCGLCNNIIQWILKNDKKKLFFFSSLNSNFARDFIFSRIDKHLLPDSIVFYKEDKIYFEYEAVLEILSLMYPWLNRLKKILKISPLILIGNFFYRIIAKYRKKLFKPKCMLVQGSIYENRFLY